jgi:hypothetical protein
VRASVLDTIPTILFRRSGLLRRRTLIRVLEDERRKRAAEALSYNGLVQSWPEIMRLAHEIGCQHEIQTTMFDNLESQVMSRLQATNGDDHPEAAHKHLLDAQALLSQQRADGAAYLSGYVVECALKSLWLHETGVPPGSSMPWGQQGHNLNYLAAQVNAVATVAGAKTARYYKQATSSVSSSAIAAWRPEMRYRAAAMTYGDAGAWYQIADDVFQETVAQMRLDGVL